MLDIAAAVPFSLWKVLCGGVPEYVRNLRAFVRTGATVTIRDGKSANAFVLARLPGLSRPVNIFLGGMRGGFICSWGGVLWWLFLT